MPGYAEKAEDDVIEAINLTRMCDAYGTLPRAGGVLDQDSYHIWLIEQVHRADKIKWDREHPKK